MEDARNPDRPDQFVGSAVVTGASCDHRTTILQLQTFAGRRLSYSLDDIPDAAGEAEFRRNDPRPVSVKIQQGGQYCSVVTLTSDGMRSSRITLGTALALHQSGVHTVVDGGRQAEVSCSTFKPAKGIASVP